VANDDAALMEISAVLKERHPRTAAAADDFAE
jgi:hypothetical protein